MNVFDMNTTAKRLLLGGVAVLGVVALAGCGGGSGVSPTAPQTKDCNGAPIPVAQDCPEPGDDGDDDDNGGTTNGSQSTNPSDNQSTNPEVNITTSSLSVDEDGTTTATDITVTLDRAAPEGGLTLTFTVTGNASVADFAAISVNGVTVSDDFMKITVTIPEGETSLTVPVTVNDDGDQEGPERLVLTLDPGDDYRRGSRNVFTLTINGSDGYTPPVTPRVEFSTATASVDESAGTYEITVELDSAREADVVLSYTVAGTAASGSDYTAPSGTVTIPAGDTSAVISVPIINDTANEIAETIIVTISSSDDYDIGTGTFTLTINSDPSDRPNDGIEVGTGAVGGLQGASRDNVKMALDASPLVGGVPTSGDPARPVSTSSWGVWIQGTDLFVWHGPPDNSYGQFPTLPDTGSATYEGKVAGIGYHGTTGSETFGSFGADIELEAMFAEGSITGTVSNFSGTGASSAWGDVTLGDSGSVSGGATGEWDHSYYRKAASGNPDGMTGYVDLTFSDGEAVGAFHAPRKP